MTVSSRNVAPFAYTVPDATRVAGIGTTTLYAEIRAGRINAVKCGKRTLIMADSLRDWLASLPSARSERR